MSAPAHAAASGGAFGVFDYELPPGRIALHPAAERDASRLLVVERHGRALEHRVFRDLPDLLAPGDLLVLNDSRVFPARLRGERVGGAPVEVLLTERLDLPGQEPPPPEALAPGAAAPAAEAAAWAAGSAAPGAAAPAAGNSAPATERWAVLARLSGRVKPGEVWDLGPGLSARVVVRLPDKRLEVEMRGRRPVLEMAEERGETPLPPYIKRALEPALDTERYQTVYARHTGSCAAPTAGLHFTPRLLEALRARGIRAARLTLHVGWATFRPLRPEDPLPPPVPPEPYTLPQETVAAVEETRARGGRVVAVGTTSARVLEACAAAPQGLRAGSGRCALTILPGHRFQAVDALLTNFHLPRTTLLMLVAAFAGESACRAAYEEALRAGYRFYSYGDAMLILSGRGAEGERRAGGGTRAL